MKNSISEGPWVVETDVEFSISVGEEEIEVAKDGTLATKNPKHLTADASILSLSCWLQIQKINQIHLPREGSGRVGETERGQGAGG